MRNDNKNNLIPILSVLYPGNSSFCKVGFSCTGLLYILYSTITNRIQIDSIAQPTNLLIKEIPPSCGAKS